MTRYSNYNANPDNKRVGDCTVRAISKATGESWDSTFLQLMLQGLRMKDMPTANRVWGSYLRKLGFRRYPVEDYCFSVDEFCRRHPYGTYVLALSGHVIAVIDGQYFDTWDSGNEVPLYYWTQEG